MTVSLAFGEVCSVLIVKCQDHYNVDVVLAVGITIPPFSNSRLEALARAWGLRNFEVECRLLVTRANKKVLRVFHFLRV